MGQTERLMQEVVKDIRTLNEELNCELTGCHDIRSYPDMSRAELVGALSGGVAFLRGLQAGTLTEEQARRMFPGARFGGADVGCNH